MFIKMLINISDNYTSSVHLLIDRPRIKNRYRHEVRQPPERRRCEEEANHLFYCIFDPPNVQNEKQTFISNKVSFKFLIYGSFYCINIIHVDKSKLVVWLAVTPLTPSGHALRPFEFLYRAYRE